MSRFAFKARGPHGVIEGVQDGETPGDVAQALTLKGLVPLAIQPEKAQQETAAKTASAPVSLPEWLQPKVQPTDLMMFSRQIYALFKAGVPILRALSGLQDTAQNPKMKAVLLDLRRSLESGLELSTAMLHHPGVFDAFYVSMIKVGEASGKLEEVFFRLFKHIEFEMFMRQQVKSALRYPSFVILAMAIAVGVINVMVIPAFAGIFKNLKGGVPLPTKILMTTSEFTIQYGWWLGIGAVVVFFLWRHWIKTPDGHLIWDGFLLKAPIVGPIVSKAALSRFTRAFAMSLKSGVPLEKALQGVATAADNAYMTKRIEGMKDRVLRGETLTAAAVWAGIFTPMAMQMLAIGEETGMLDDMLEEIGELYSNEVQYELKTLSQKIEPILVMFMGGLVLVLALGVFLPMWSLGDATFKK
jgi:MSHA biogenesis protein MshG